jgi:hypothetical protein
LGGVLWCIRVALNALGGEPSALAGNLLFVVPLLFGAGLGGFYMDYWDRMATGFFVDLTLGIEEGVRISSFGFLILTLGLVVLGFATLKTEPLYRWNFLPLAIGTLTLFNVIVSSYDLLRTGISLLFGLGWLAWGILMLVDTRERRRNHRQIDADMR